MSERLPDFICVGTPKIATALLDRVLKSHPDVYLPVSKELHYFSFFYAKGLDSYRMFFEEADGYSAVGEISPSYFYHSEAASRIRGTLGDVKIIITLRDPAELVYSVCWKIKRHNFYQYDDNDIGIGFEKALEKCPHRLYWPALFHTHLTHWYEVFDREQILVIFHDDIKHNFNDVMVRLFDFVGVSSGQGVLDALNSKKAVLSGVSPRGKLIASAYGFVYVLLNKGVLMPLKKLIGYKAVLYIKVKLRIRQLLGAVFFKKGYPVISKAHRKHLVEYFSSEIEGLEELIGRDLSHWKWF